MRILHVVSGIARQDAGPSYAVPQLCRELIRRGHDVTLCTLEPVPPDWDDSVPTTFHSSWRFPTRLGISPSMKRYLRDAVESADIVHMHGLWMMPNIYSARAARDTRVPLVFSPHGMLDAPALRISPYRKRLMWQLAQARAVKAADLIHAISPLEQEHIRTVGLRTPVTVVPLGVELPALGPPVREPVVLYLGRLHPKKNPESLIRAWALVEAEFPEWRLRLVGPAISRTYQTSLQRLVREVGASRIDMPGPAYGDEKAGELARASLFVLPTRSENFGVAVAEALAAGIPAIVTKGAPWSGLQEHGCGWWIDHGVEPLTLALRQALRLPRHRLAEMGEISRQWIGTDYSWPAIARQIEDMYRSVINASVASQFHDTVS